MESIYTALGSNVMWHDRRWMIDVILNMNMNMNMNMPYDTTYVCIISL